MLHCAVSPGKMPTVVSPELYRARFCEAMDKYFLMVPDHWTGLGINCWAVETRVRSLPHSLYAQKKVIFLTEQRPRSTLDVVNVWMLCGPQPDQNHSTVSFHWSSAALQLRRYWDDLTRFLITGDADYNLPPSGFLPRFTRVCYFKWCHESNCFKRTRWKPSVLWL